jgi:hypothetical protein
MTYLQKQEKGGGGGETDINKVDYSILSVDACREGTD